MLPVEECRPLRCKGANSVLSSGLCKIVNAHYNNKHGHWFSGFNLLHMPGEEALHAVQLISVN